MVESVREFLQLMGEQYAQITAFKWFDEEKGSIESRTYQEYVTDILKFSGFLRGMADNTKRMQITSKNKKLCIYFDKNRQFGCKTCI